jgi:hypothetical protein
VVNPNSKEGRNMAYIDTHTLLSVLTAVVALLAGYDFRGKVETWDATRSEVRSAVAFVEWIMRGLVVFVLIGCAAIFFLGSGTTVWLGAGLGIAVLVVVVRKTLR